MIVALEVWGSDFDQVLATCQLAEQLGFDAFYYGESPHGLNLDCWTTLAALARSTSRLRLGPVITNILPSYRSTALLAKQAATVARIAGGRLDFRTGVGASVGFARPWWEPHGVVYPDYDQRLADLDRALDTMQRLWTPGADGHDSHDSDDSHDGHDSDDGHDGHDSDDRQSDRGTDPPPGGSMPPIPVTIAATGRRAMELAAARADGWETSFCTPAEMAKRIDAMSGFAGGRPITSSLEIDGFVSRTPSGFGRLIDRVRGDREEAEDLEPVLSRALTGEPADVTGQIRALARIGVDQLVVALHDPHDPDALEALAEAMHRARAPESGIGSEDRTREESVHPGS